MWTKKRHNIVFAVLRPIFAAYYYLFHKCSVKKQPLPPEGAVIVSNHVTTLDPVLVALKFNKPVYFMTSKHVFQNRWIGKVLKFLVNPIPKEKINKSDISAIKACISIARENGSICIFPEGNRTFSGKLGYVDPAIAKLVKRLDKPLVICNILGGYGADPRWSNGIRRGKMDVSVKKVYSCKELQAMTNEQVYSAIVSGITVDEFATGARYRNSRRAECLESAVYICPMCGGSHTIYTKKHNVYCNACGMTLTYNEDMTLSCEDPRFPFRYVHEWYDYQLKVLQEMAFAEEQPIYQDAVAVYNPQMHKQKELLGQGDIRLYDGSICFALDTTQIELPIDCVEGITLIGNRIMDIYSGDRTYRVIGAHKTNFIKYMHTFYIIHNRKKDIADGFIGI